MPLNKTPKVGDEVKLLAYINTVRDDFELSPGDEGNISRIEGNDIRIDVVYSNARSNNPMGLEHEDYIIIPLDEIEDYLEDYFHIDED